MITNTDIHRTRIVYDRSWDMQILFIKGEGYQATYFHGADPQIWSDCFCTPEEAAIDLDLLVDKHYGKDNVHYVRVGLNVPTPIYGFSDAVKFCNVWNAVLLTPIHNP
jgi:hypothetical protein